MKWAGDSPGQDEFEMCSLCGSTKVYKQPCTCQNTTALYTQVGGNHYKDFPIQPVEFCQVNKLPYCESNVIKYMCRWRDKGGLESLKKARHYIDLLIEIEGLEDEDELSEG